MDYNISETFGVICPNQVKNMHEKIIFDLVTAVCESWSNMVTVYM